MAMLNNQMVYIYIICFNHNSDRTTLRSQNYFPKFPSLFHWYSLILRWVLKLVNWLVCCWKNPLQLGIEIPYIPFESELLLEYVILWKLAYRSQCWTSSPTPMIVIVIYCNILYSILDIIWYNYINILPANGPWYHHSYYLGCLTKQFTNSAGKTSALPSRPLGTKDEAPTKAGCFACGTRTVPPFFFSNCLLLPTRETIR